MNKQIHSVYLYEPYILKLKYVYANPLCLQAYFTQIEIIVWR